MFESVYAVMVILASLFVARWILVVLETGEKDDDDSK